MCYSLIEVKILLVKYELHKVNDVCFRFKLDLNEVNNDFEPHIWIRHLITPEEAITAYFNQIDKEYNQKNKRWESYSEPDDIYLYYMILNNREIMVITAFKI